jgi:hypothetical protein
MFYVILVAMMLSGVGAVVFFNFNRVFQTVVVIILAMIYVLWGLVYHLFKKDFHLKVLWEYLLVAALAGLSVTFLLWRS